jgi:hypothetical protein
MIYPTPSEVVRCIARDDKATAFWIFGEIIGGVSS